MEAIGRRVFEHIEPLGTSRDHHRRTSEMREQGSPGLLDRLVVFKRAGDKKTGLFRIAHNQARASIGE